MITYIEKARWLVDAVIDLDAETEWTNCAGIANTEITGINNVSG